MSGYMPSPIAQLNALFNSDGADKLKLVDNTLRCILKYNKHMSKHKQTCQLQIKEHLEILQKVAKVSFFSTDHVCKLSQKINQSGINY